MSNISVICRRMVPARINFTRSVSTQYVPGQKGYAPGFQAPDGTRDTLKENHKRRQLGSLTSHLSSTNIKPTEVTTSAKKTFRQELKVTRHKYARELLQKQAQKDLKSSEKLLVSQQLAQQTKEKFEVLRQEQKEHEQQVVDILSLDQTQEEKTNDRDQLRLQNRILHEQQERNTRRKQLLKLYATTNDFVTLDNLDAKVDSVISTEGRSFHESLTELMNNTNSIQTEIEQRKLQLKQVMGL
ncbi:hypothetical protein BDF21DRAFT_409595 [Thamnidium elegans]|uniref:Uncharacterized protein n=1 Tax=Thamnidium elegans TaxID=101142 RepID=A0A8H7SQ55_9FUNG|nr:hypothetical protein INT48_006785 [Thamnidium elegans]KAI8091520.1 hypothetical protein BDF21DRAFT_409595 [Thamnidium elegans]